MAIIDMRRIIRIIPDQMLPKAALPFMPRGYTPRSPLATRTADRLSVIGKALENPCLMTRQRLALSSSSTGNVHTQCKCSGKTTHASMWNGQRLRVSWTNNCAQNVNMAHQKIIAVSFQQIDSEKIRPARNAVSTIIWHISLCKYLKTQAWRILLSMRLFMRRNTLRYCALRNASYRVCQAKPDLRISGKLLLIISLVMPADAEDRQVSRLALH